MAFQTEKRNTNQSSGNMLLRNFRTAAKGFGEYDAAKNELVVRKDGEIYRFSCGEGLFRFTTPSKPEVVFPIAPDATVRELRLGIAMLIDPPQECED